MYWFDFLLIAILAIGLSTILTSGLHWRHPANRKSTTSSLLFLLIIFALMMWVGGSWLPASSYIWLGSTAWLNILLIGVLIALLVLALAIPAKPNLEETNVESENPEEVVAGTIFGIFFWILAIGLFFTGLAHLIA